MITVFLNKVLDEHKRYYVIVDKDSIVSLFTAKERNNIVEVLNKGISTKELSTEYSIIDITLLNTMYRCYQNLERGEPLSKSDYTSIKNIADTTETFFPKYILSQIYREVDKEKAVELYTELLNDTVAFSRKRYAEEYIELITSKNRLIIIENQYIPFVEYEYDFGEMSVGDSRNCTFHYSNSSRYKFVIYNVSTSCGCTVASWNSLPLAPNCSDSMIVNFEANRKGFVKKQITINGNTEQRIILSIKADVK